MLHLCGGIGKDLGVGVRRSACRITWVPKQVGCPPQEPRAGLGHVRFDALDDPVETGAAFSEGAGLRCYVPVVKTEEGYAELVEELESCVGFLLGECHRLFAVGCGSEPRALEGSVTEDVASRPAEGVPITDGETKMILHANTRHESLGVVVAEGEIVRGIGPLVGNAIDVGKEGRVTGRHLRISSNEFGSFGIYPQNTIAEGRGASNRKARCRRRDSPGK